MNPYDILGLGSDCTAKEIKNAYRILSKTHHPDVGGNAEAFAKISIAVEVLRDPVRRKFFDDYGIYMEESAETLQNVITQKFTELVHVWVQESLQSEHDINIQNFFSAKLNFIENSINQTGTNIERRVKKLKKILSQCTVIGERNILQEVVTKQLEELAAAKNTNAKDKLILKLVREECSKYSSVEDPMIQRTVRYTSGATSTFTMF